MAQPPQTNWIASAVLWFFGTALFLAISLLPNVLLARFYTGGRVHAIVLPTVAVLVLLLWVTTTFATKDARRQHPK